MDLVSIAQGYGCDAARVTDLEVMAMRIFHWKRGWIPLTQAAFQSRSERVAASRAKNAGRDEAKAQRLAEHRATTADKEEARRVRYMAAQNPGHPDRDY